MAHLLWVLRDYVCGGVRVDEVGFSGEPKPELLVGCECLGDACFHEHRVCHLLGALFLDFASNVVFLEKDGISICMTSKFLDEEGLLYSSADHFS